MMNKQTELTFNQASPIGSNWMKKQIQKFEVLSSTHQWICLFQTTLGCRALMPTVPARQVSLDGRMYQDLREILQAGGFGAVDRLNK